MVNMIKTGICLPLQNEYCSFQSFQSLSLSLVLGLNPEFRDSRDEFNPLIIRVVVEEKGVHPRIGISCLIGKSKAISSLINVTNI